MRTGSLLPQASGGIGDFSRPDGFHPSEQGAIAASSPESTLASMSSRTRPNRGDDGRVMLSDLDVDLPNQGGKKKRFGRKSKKPRSKKRLALKISGFVILCMLLTAGFLFGKAFLKSRNIFKGGSDGAAALDQDVDPAKLRGEGDGRVNILLLGKGGDGHQAPDLTDTILLASIDPVQKEAALLSIPRDLYVKAPGGGRSKINAIYANAKYQELARATGADKEEQAEKAGLAAIEKTIQNTMGVPIHYHVMVDFTAFRDAVNTVGGIDLDVKTPVYEVLWLEETGKHYTLDVRVGREHFDGRRALAYSRSRYTSARGDFDRTERQRAVIVALKDKILSAGTFSNPVKLSKLIDDFGDHVQANMTTSELLRIYELGRDITADKIVSLGLADPPNAYVKTDNIGGLSVVVPRAGLDNYTEIQNYVRNAMKDGFIKKENAQIVVLNGTTTGGLATQKANELKSFGYNVTSIADAPTKNYTKTVLVDLRSGSKKYTKHYLEQRFGVTATNKLPDPSINPGQADFVIILGQ
jgi:polyisoprenyl-teichoic acid--peptidoglycan teichoic acid transferase